MKRPAPMSMVMRITAMQQTNQGSRARLCSHWAAGQRQAAIRAAIVTGRKIEAPKVNATVTPTNPRIFNPYRVAGVRLRFITAMVLGAETCHQCAMRRAGRLGVDQESQPSVARTFGSIIPLGPYNPPF